MGMKLEELQEGTPVTLWISNKEKNIELAAVIKKHVRSNIAFITLQYETTKKLVFDKVQVDMEYYQDGNVPIIWHNIRIKPYQSDYVIQVSSEGIKHNRRSFFRVGISMLAQIRTVGVGLRDIMVKDLSMSGFAVSDRKKKLKMSLGDELSVYFEDSGHEIALTGNVVRIEEQEDVFIYGLKISNICKDLPSYISVKQVKRR